MAREVRVKAPAKINLCLHVLGRRPDGYHEIRTVMQAVSLFDELSFSARTDGEIVLSASGEGLPAPADNLVVRAARLLRRECGCGKGVDIELVKKIPIGSGLGGGSSNCAAALAALNDLWDLALALDDLAGLAAQLGSDVAFFLRGGTALCEGRGERVTVVPAEGTQHYVLVMPSVPISTREVYGAVGDSLTKDEQTDRIGAVQAALATGDAQRLGSALYNDLEAPALRLHPRAQRIRELFELACPRLGCLGLSLSGSGSSLFGVFETQRCAQKASSELARELNVPVLAVHSLPPGR